jgi:hypothetical protein
MIMKKIGDLIIIVFIVGLFAAIAFAQVPQPPQPSGIGPGTINWNVGQVTVLATATLVVPARPSRAHLTITNPTNGNVWCGPDNTVTITTGDIVMGTNTAANPRIYETQAAVWCIASTPQVITFSELY